MIFNRSPFKTFFRALKEGVFGIPIDTGTQAPLGYVILIDNDNDYLVNNDAEYMSAPL